MIQKIKQTFELIWKEFIYGGHIFSLGAVSVVLVSAFLLEIEITIDYLIIIYAGIHLTYLYNRYKELRDDVLTNPQRTNHLKKYHKIIPYIISALILVIIVVLLFSGKIFLLPIIFLLILIGLSYSVFFKKYTKFILTFKVFFVSFSWTLLVILLAFYYSYPFNFPLTLILIFIFLRFFIHENFSDVKDIESDKKNKLLTLPIVLGEKKLFYFLKIINFFTALPLILGVYLNQLPQYSLFLLLTIPYTFYCFKKTEDVGTDKNILYNVLIDGEYILWIVFVLSGKFIL